MPTKKLYRTGSIRVVVDYGYDVHEVEFSKRTYNRIVTGKIVTLRGSGFSWEGERDQDFWAFNFREQGSLDVYTGNGGEIFAGHLGDGEVFVESGTGPSET